MSDTKEKDPLSLGGSSAEEIASTDDDDDEESRLTIDSAPKEEAGGAWEVIGAMVETVPSDETADDAVNSDETPPSDGVTPMPLEAPLDRDSQSDCGSVKNE